MIVYIVLKLLIILLLEGFILALTGTTYIHNDFSVAINISFIPIKVSFVFCWCIPAILKLHVWEILQD